MPKRGALDSLARDSSDCDLVYVNFICHLCAFHLGRCITSPHLTSHLLEDAAVQVRGKGVRVNPVRCQLLFIQPVVAVQIPSQVLLMHHIALAPQAPPEICH